MEQQNKYRVIVSERGGRTLLSASSALWNGNTQLDVYFRSRSLCGNGIYQIQRYDRRAVCLGVDEVRICDAKKTVVPSRKSLL